MAQPPSEMVGDGIHLEHVAGELGACSPPPKTGSGCARRGARPAVVVPVLAVLAAVGGQLPSFSRQANLYVLVIGAALTWLGLSGRLRRRPVAPVPALAGEAASGPPTPPPSALGLSSAPVVAWPDTRALRWWWIPVVVFVPVEAVNFALGSTHAHPTVSVLLDPLFTGELPRSVLYFGWLAAFWALIRR